MSCSFLDIVGGICGAEERARHPSTQTVSLSSRSKDIRSHKHFLQFSGVVETETELILARSGIFVKPINFSEMTVCPLHRSSLGIGWRRASRLFSVPQDVSGHKKESKEVPRAERGITLQHSKHIFELTKNLVPVGSGKPFQCLFSLYAQINIHIASHFMQDTWREITYYISYFQITSLPRKITPSLTAKLFSCLTSFQDFCKHFYVRILFKHLVQLINGVGNPRIEIFTDIRIPSNNARNKERSVKD